VITAERFTPYLSAIQIRDHCWRRHGDVWKGKA
jgi:hypothetical protein